MRKRCEVTQWAGRRPSWSFGPHPELLGWRSGLGGGTGGSGGLLPARTPFPACSYVGHPIRGNRNGTQLRDVNYRDSCFVLLNSEKLVSKNYCILFFSSIIVHQSSKKKLLCLLKFESLMLFFESIIFINLRVLRAMFFVKKFKFHNKGTQFPSSLQLLLKVVQTRFGMKLNMVCRLQFPHAVMELEKSTGNRRRPASAEDSAACTYYITVYMFSGNCSASYFHH